MEATFTSQADERQKNTKSQRDGEGVTEKTVTDRLTDIKIAFQKLSSPVSLFLREKTLHLYRARSEESLTAAAFDSCLDV